MLHTRPRLAVLLALVAALVLAPAAAAAVPSRAPAGAQAKERAYGKQCGPKRKGPGRAGERVKCLEAMARLATGKSSSPQKACRALSRKKAKGARSSAYAQCVSAGAKLLKSRRRTNSDSPAGDDDAGAGIDDSSGNDDGDGADINDDLDLLEPPSDDDGDGSEPDGDAPDPDDADPPA